MDFMRWMEAWLKRHPLKEPPASVQARYTEQVMTRVQATHRGAQKASYSLRVFWPRFALAMTAAAAMLVLVRVTPRPSHSIAQSIAEETDLLAAVTLPEDEMSFAAELFSETDTDGLAEELRTMDLLVVAQDTRSDGWVEETLQLLDQLEEDFPEEENGGSKDEDWLKELEMLDEADLSASS